MIIKGENKLLRIFGVISLVFVINISPLIPVFSVRAELGGTAADRNYRLPKKKTVKKPAKPKKSTQKPKSAPKKTGTAAKAKKSTPKKSSSRALVNYRNLEKKDKGAAKKPAPKKTTTAAKKTSTPSKSYTSYRQSEIAYTNSKPKKTTAKTRGTTKPKAKTSSAIKNKNVEYYYDANDLKQKAKKEKQQQEIAKYRNTAAYKQDVKERARRAANYNAAKKDPKAYEKLHTEWDGKSVPVTKPKSKNTASSFKLRNLNNSDKKEAEAKKQAELLKSENQRIMSKNKFAVENIVKAEEKAALAKEEAARKAKYQAEKRREALCKTDPGECVRFAAEEKKAKERAEKEALKYRAEEIRLKSQNKEAMKRQEELDNALKVDAGENVRLAALNKAAGGNKPTEAQVKEMQDKLKSDFDKGNYTNIVNLAAANKRTARNQKIIDNYLYRVRMGLPISRADLEAHQRATLQIAKDEMNTNLYNKVKYQIPKYARDEVNARAADKVVSERQKELNALNNRYTSSENINKGAELVAKRNALQDAIDELEGKKKLTAEEKKTLAKLKKERQASEKAISDPKNRDAVDAYREQQKEAEAIQKYYSDMYKTGSDGKTKRERIAQKAQTGYQDYNDSKISSKAKKAFTTVMDNTINTPVGQDVMWFFDLVRGSVWTGIGGTVNLFNPKNRMSAETKAMVRENIKDGKQIIKHLEALKKSQGGLSESAQAELDGWKRYVAEGERELKNPYALAWEEFGPNADPLKTAENYDLNTTETTVLFAGFVLLDPLNAVGGAGLASKVDDVAKVSKVLPALKVLNFGADSLRVLNKVDDLADAARVANALDDVGDVARAAADVSKYVDDIVDAAKRGEQIAVAIDDVSDTSAVARALPGASKAKKAVVIVTKENADDFARAMKSGQVKNADEVIEHIAKSQGKTAAKVSSEQATVLKNLQGTASKNMSTQVTKAQEALNVAKKADDPVAVAKARTALRNTRSEYLDLALMNKSAWNPTTIPLRVERAANNVAKNTARVGDTLGNVARNVNQAIKNSTGLNLADDTGSVSLDLLDPFQIVNRGQVRDTLPANLPEFSQADDLADYVRETRTVQTSFGPVSGDYMATVIDKILENARNGVYRNNPSELTSDLTKVTSNYGLRSKVEKTVSGLSQRSSVNFVDSTQDVARRAPGLQDLSKQSDFSQRAFNNSTPVGSGAYGETKWSGVNGADNNVITYRPIEQPNWEYPLSVNGKKVSGEVLKLKTGDYKVHVAISDEADLVTVRNHLTPWLAENDINTYKRMPLDFEAKTRYRFGSEQGSKGFTIYVESEADAAALGRKVDEFLDSRGLGKSQPIQDGNAGINVGFSNRVVITRDYMPGEMINPRYGVDSEGRTVVVGADQVLAKIDSDTASKVLARYANGDGNQFLLDVGVKPGSLVKKGDDLYLNLLNYEVDAYKYVKDTAGRVYLAETGGTDASRKVLQRLYRAVGDDPVEVGMGLNKAVGVKASAGDSFVSRAVKALSDDSGFINADVLNPLAWFGGGQSRTAGRNLSFGEGVADFFTRSNPITKRRATRLSETLRADIARVADEDVAGFVKSFNKENPLKLRSQEFTVVSSRSDSLVIVNGVGEVEQIKITADNAEEVLRKIKVDDVKLRGDSYELREEILRRSEGRVESYQAYTYQSDVPADKLKEYLDDPYSWLPERRKFHKELIDSEYQKAVATSGRLDDDNPTIYVLRGNTASGKTTSLGENPLFAKAKNGKKGLEGAVNPDKFKELIIEGNLFDQTTVLSHGQTHVESSLLGRTFQRKLLGKKGLSIVIDKRTNDLDDVTNIFRDAIQTGRKVKILDVDVPLESSLVRILGRTPGGPDPLVPLSEIIKGFKGIRENRAKLHIDVEENDFVQNYVLYGLDETGRSVLIAEKINGKIVPAPGMEKRLEEMRLMGLDSAKETEETISRVINEQYIEEVLSRTPEDYREGTRAALEQYYGMTLGEAVDTHSKARGAVRVDEAYPMQSKIVRFFTGIWNPFKK